MTGRNMVCRVTTRPINQFAMIKSFRSNAMAMPRLVAQIFSVSLAGTLRIAIAVLLCAMSENARAADRPPGAAELREWAAGPCVDAARHIGLDYARSLDRAIAGDPEGLAALFRFTDSGWFDGAAAEGHCAILFGLLQRWGDRPFARVLRAQKRPIRKAVREAVISFPGFKPDIYPLTNASAPN
jgi:hypothetical protein